MAPAGGRRTQPWRKRRPAAEGGQLVQEEEQEGLLGRTVGPRAPARRRRPRGTTQGGARPTPHPGHKAG
eukprot:2963533-Alexandrium_andersonii.AAC.1